MKNILLFGVFDKTLSHQNLVYPILQHLKTITKVDKAGWFSAHNKYFTERVLNNALPTVELNSNYSMFGQKHVFFIAGKDPISADAVMSLLHNAIEAHNHPIPIKPENYESVNVEINGMELTLYYSFIKTNQANLSWVRSTHNRRNSRR